MWTWDEIEGMNPAEAGQHTSFLSHLLEIGAASEELLCTWSDYLEEAGSPAVACFCQLPYSVKVDPAAFKVKGWREGVVVDLHCEPVMFEIDLSGRFFAHHQDLSHQKKQESTTQIVGTQIIAVIRLWGARTKLHKEYLRHLTPKGLNNGIIGESLGWMQLPSGGLPPHVREYSPLSTQAFQSEAARRLRTEVAHALRTFIGAYSIANLEELPHSDMLHGYFIMLAPGRVACASAPLPIQAGFLKAQGTVEQATVNRARIQSLLEVNLNKEDRVLTQLMAMKKLLKQQEPELALVGLVTAIEWFLNERFPEVAKQSTSGRKISASISRLIKIPALEFLTESDRSKLLELSQLRNESVHGAPPGRHSPSSNSRKIDSHYVIEGLALGLELYRTVNLHYGAARQKPKNVQQSASADSADAPPLS